MNGEAERRPDAIYVATQRVYGNCPKYIQARVQEIGGAEPSSQGVTLMQSRGLTDEQRRLV